MIFKTKKAIAEHLGCYRQKIDYKIKTGEVIVLYNTNGDRLGYSYSKELLIFIIQNLWQQ